MKTCNVCKISKLYNEYNKQASSKDGFKSICRECNKIKSKLYYNKTIDYQKIRKKPGAKSNSDLKLEKANNLLKLNKKLCTKCGNIKDTIDFDKDSSKKDGLYSSCKPCRSDFNSEKYKKNPELKIQKSRNYYKNNKEKCIKKTTEYKLKRKKEDPFFKFKENLKSCIREYLKENGKVKNKKTEDILQCDYKFFKKYIENQFTEGMSWDNYGKVDGWSLDHIIPLSLAEDEETCYKLNHYTNLRPLWSSENSKKGIKLDIDFSEYQLKKYELLPNELNKQYLLNQKINHKFNARDCKIVELNILAQREFFNNYHIQGYRSSTVCYGLMLNNKVLMAASFGKPMFNDKFQWEIIRMASVTGSRVRGGASKLFKHFIKTHNPSNILTYSDLRFGEGDVYEKLGMIKVENTQPNYFYVKGNIVYTRYKCTKSKIKNFLHLFFDKLSEKDNMYINGFKKYNDLGNSKYIWIK